MITDERLKELIDDYGAKLPDDYQNVKNFWNEMKSALSELLALRQQKRDLIEDAERLFIEGTIWVTEDVKGVETAVFRLKAKLFKSAFPGYELRIVR